MYTLNQGYSAAHKRKQPTFATPALVSPWNDLSGTTAELPYWLPRSGYSAPDWLKQISLTTRPIRSNTQIWVVTGHRSMEFLQSLLRRHFQGNKCWGCKIFVVFSGYCNTGAFEKYRFLLFTVYIFNGLPSGTSHFQYNVLLWFCTLTDLKLHSYLA